MNTDRYKLFNYAISGDPEEVDNNQHFSPEIEELLRRTFMQVKKQKFRTPVRLLKLIEKYPHVPAFKNYLTVFYQLKGNTEKAYQTNQWLAKEHPDYLFGKLNLAGQYIEQDRLDEVPKVLGEALDLQDLYPGRKVFHLTEFRSFFSVTAQYFLAKGELETLESRMEMAERVLGGEDEIFSQLRFQILGKRAELFSQRQAEAQAKRDGTPVGRSYDKTVQTDEPPVFHHEETRQLYQHGLDIDPDILKSILALPRETLAQDLETVLTDSLRRFDLFQIKMEEGNWEDEEMSFPLHALFLLTELGGAAALPAIFEHLRQGEEFLEFWYGDHLFETLWHFVYRLGQDDLDQLKAFMLERDIAHEAKTVVAQAVHQMAHHQPERKAGVIQWYEDILDHFLDHLDDADLIDVGLIAPLLSNLVDLQAKHLLPKIKRFYELDLVDEFYVGDYKSVETDLLNDREFSQKHKVFESSFDHYKHILSTWHGYMTEEQRAERDKKWQARMAELDKGKRPPSPFGPPPTPAPQGNWDWPDTVKRDQPKVGRNDPCPCGSGKKYKKCCLRK